MINKIRVDEIDIAKGIGIILVLIGHCLPNNSLPRLIIYSFHEQHIGVRPHEIPIKKIKQN